MAWVCVRMGLRGEGLKVPYSLAEKMKKRHKGEFSNLDAANLDDIIRLVCKLTMSPQPFDYRAATELASRVDCTALHNAVHAI